MDLILSTDGIPVTVNECKTAILPSIDAFADLVLILDEEAIVLRASASSRHLLGYGAAELVGRSLHDLLAEGSRPQLQALREHLARGEAPSPTNIEVITASGNPRSVELSLRRIDSEEGPGHCQGLIRDNRPAIFNANLLLEQKRRVGIIKEIAELQSANTTAESYMQAVMETLLALARCTGGTLYRRKEGCFHGKLSVGAAAALPKRIDPEAEDRRPLPDGWLSFPKLIDHKNLISRCQLLRELVPTHFGSAVLLPLAVRGRVLGLILLASEEDQIFDAELKVMLRQQGDMLGQVLENQSLRQQSQELHHRFKDLTEGSEDHIWEVDTAGRYTFNSPSVYFVLGRRPEQLLGRHYMEFIHPEDKEETTAFLEELQKERKPLQGMIHRCLNTAEEIVYMESRAFPILGENGQVSGYRGIDRNISAWFESRSKLEEMLIGTCEALSRMVELRDPYTKGHSVRVSDLSVLIGEAMGHSQNDLKGLRLMGLLHDLGKIGIPTEILSKPGRLSAEELDLLRAHPAMGFEILKGISFPWPVAAVVHEHHERLDGSGYPQGLMGDEIRWQVRVMAIADLLEAMATDRPYRPGLGLDRAIEELERNRGRLFDPEIVDAVLGLRESGILGELFASQAKPHHCIRMPDGGMKAFNETEQLVIDEKHPDFVQLALESDES